MVKKITVSSQVHCHKDFYKLLNNPPIIPHPKYFFYLRLIKFFLAYRLSFSWKMFFSKLCFNPSPFLAYSQQVQIFWNR